MKKYLALIFLIVIFSASAFAVSDTNLVGWWKLDEATGNAIDYKGFDNNCSNTSLTQGSAGIIGNSYTYSASSSLSDCGSGNLNIVGKISISAWIYPTTFANDEGYVINRVAVGNVMQYRIKDQDWSKSDGKPIFTIGSSGGDVSVSSSIAMQANKWNFVVATWDGTSNANGMKIYVNGNLGAQGTWNAGTQDTTTNSTKFGISGLGNGAFTGRLDEVGIWSNRVLSTQDITDLNNSGVGVTYCGYGDYDSNFMSTCTKTADPCAPTLNANWVVTSALDCNSKTISLGTGRLVLSTGGKLRLFSSTLTAKGWDINASGSSLTLGSGSWIKVG